MIVQVDVERGGVTPRLMCTTQQMRKSTSTENVMLRQAAIISSDRADAFALAQSGDFHDVTGHHRYYGSSATNGGERITATRRGPRPQGLNVLGF
jgi:hypothetical protein